MADFTAVVDYIARLARLKLQDDEKVQMAGQLKAILDAAGRVREPDVTGVEPTSHVISFPGNYRDDVVVPSMPLSDVLQNAPDTEAGYIRVPKIFTDGTGGE